MLKKIILFAVLFTISFGTGMAQLQNIDKAELDEKFKAFNLETILAKAKEASLLTHKLKEVPFKAAPITGENFEPFVEEYEYVSTKDNVKQTWVIRKGAAMNPEYTYGSDGEYYTSSSFSRIFFKLNQEEVLMSLASEMIIPNTAETRKYMAETVASETAFERILNVYFSPKYFKIEVVHSAKIDYLDCTTPFLKNKNVVCKAVPFMTLSKKNSSQKAALYMVPNVEALAKDLKFVSAALKEASKTPTKK